MTSKSETSVLVVTRKDVYECARTWLGTAFHHAATIKGVGVDCRGLLVGIARELGLIPIDWDVPPYLPNPDGHSMIEQCDQYLTKVPNEDMQAGDIVVIAVDKDPQHLGILAPYKYGGLSIIHAAMARDKSGKVVEHRLVWSTRQKLVAVYAFKGLSE